MRSTIGASRTALLAATLALTSCTADPSAPATSGNGERAPGAGGAANYVSATGGGPATAGGAGSVAPPASGGARNDAGAAPIAAEALPDYDARVAFDWPESVGDGGTTCQAGHYKGTFQCNFVPSFGDAGAAAGTPTTPFPVTGPIELVLTESQNGEFLEVSGGTLNGAALIAITFTGKISGKLDCQTKQFTGMVTDGQYGIQPFPPGGGFQGPTDATYSSAGPALVNGSWHFSVQTPQGAPYGSCDGTWTATYAP